MGTSRRFRVHVLVAVGAMALVAASLPPSGTFRDDDGNVHEGYIEAIAAEGITRGCNPPINDAYCPKRPVTRGEMAALLARALDLPATGGFDFTDDDESVFEADIEKLAAAGITKGCNPPSNDRFCPNDPVTREQMAAFLVRALGLTETSATGFVDLEGSVFVADIEKLAAAGITKGCNPPTNDRFCPRSPVLRDQMASFLGRALGLTQLFPEPFGGEIVVGVEQEPPTLNPFVPGGDNAIVSKIGNAYFGGAYDIDGGTLEFIPDLLTELPTVANGGVVVNDDGTITVGFDIDPNAVWSDGVPVSGTDFQFTLDLIMDPDIPVDATIYEDIVSTTVQPKRFEFTLAHPTLAYERLFPVVVPEHAVAGSDFELDWNDSMWPSAGPYVFDSWVKGESLRVARNERYWKTDPRSNRLLPYADSVVFGFYPEPADLQNAVMNGLLDVVDLRPNLDTVGDLAATTGVAVDVAPGRVWEHLNFQFDPARLARNEHSINPDLDYRRAFAHLVDREAIAADVYDSWAVPLESVTGLSGKSLMTDGWSSYEFDLAEAQRLIASAKSRLGISEVFTVFSTTSNNDRRVRLAEMLVDMTDDAGLLFENQLEDSQIFFGETLDGGLWDVGSWAWVSPAGPAGAIETLQFWDPDGPPPDGPNYLRWGTPGSDVVDAATERYAEILDELDGVVDHRIAETLIEEAEQILADNVVIIPLYAWPAFLGYRPDEVGGMGATGQLFTWNIGEWYRVDL